MENIGRRWGWWNHLQPTVVIKETEGQLGENNMGLHTSLELFIKEKTSFGKGRNPGTHDWVKHLRMQVKI